MRGIANPAQGSTSDTTFSAREGAPQAPLGSRWLDAIGEADGADRPVGDMDTPGPSAVEREILSVSADEFDLLAWLVRAHDGKARMAWRASPADQEANDRLSRGVREGDVLPPVLMAGADGERRQLPAILLDRFPAEAGLS